MRNNLSTEGKTRIVQELVPGKQITIAHMIANPFGDRDADGQPGAGGSDCGGYCHKGSGGGASVCRSVRWDAACNGDGVGNRGGVKSRIGIYGRKDGVRCLSSYTHIAYKKWHIFMQGGEEGKGKTWKGGGQR